MRAWWLVALVGCDVPFDLKQIPPPDGLPACYSSKPFGGNCRMLQAQDIQDTFLQSEKPDNVVGRADALLITGADPALFKFDVSGILAGERIEDAQLVVVPVDEADNCSGSGSCPYCPILGTRWELSWMTSNWDAASATFDSNGNAPWSAPGASGIPDDRGDPVSAHVTPPSPGRFTPFVFEATSDELATSASTTPECWIANNTLGVRLTFADAVTVVSRYHKSPGGCISTGTPVPVLNLMLCQ